MSAYNWRYNTRQASHDLSHDDKQGLKMPIHTHFFRQVILTGKVGLTDLVFGMRSGFISRSVHATLQVSMISASTVNIHTHPHTKTDRQHFITLSSASSAIKLNKLAIHSALPLECHQ